jgi:tripartite-type tricarboxylate transporter receptor subunit TctC
LRILAVTTAKRSRSFPDVPTIAESGYPGYELASWNGVLAPSGTPAAIVRQLNAEINKILALPEIQGRLIDVGYEPVGGAPEDFGNLIRREISKWDPIVKAAKIKAE